MIKTDASIPSIVVACVSKSELGPSVVIVGYASTSTQILVETSSIVIPVV